MTLIANPHRPSASARRSVDGPRPFRAAAGLAPGILLCLAVAAGAAGLQAVERAVTGHVPLEALVLSILLGAAIRTAWTPGPAWRGGVDFSAKVLLEVAVVLLGASVSAKTVLAVGPALLGGIVVVVAVAIAGSYALGRVLGLPRRLAILVACGNSICGNSAIAAVAPVIGADGDDVVASIAFTAVLGVLAVLGLPLLGHALHMSVLQYGALAGLTVYAVPQVLAATAPFGPAAVQFGALVKLVRVLMLGPVCLALSFLTERLREATDEPAPAVTAGERPRGRRPAIHQLVPWFILGFLALIGLRSLGLIPAVALKPAAVAANLLTVVSMAALGLGVDVRVVGGAGGRVIAAATLALGMLILLALGLVRWLQL